MKQCFQKKCKLMGSAFELGLVAADQSEAEKLLGLGIREIERLEDLLSEFRPNSVLSTINQNSGIKKVHLNPELYDFFQRCLQLSSLTQGYFDISVGPLKALYQFKNQTIQFPTETQIQSTLTRTGFQHIELDPTDRSIFLKKKNMHLSVAAIGKGYAADQVKKIWQRAGLQSGYINASGDLTAFGKRPDGTNWKVGIANPDDKAKMLFYSPVENASVATSGDYEQHFWSDGKRYSHNINPLTGLPLHGIKSVTVFSPSAELSDSMATAVYAMGPEQGMDFIDQLPHTHAIIIDEKNQVLFSDEIQYEAIT